MLTTEERREIELMIAAIKAVYGVESVDGNQREPDASALRHIDRLQEQLDYDAGAREVRREKRAMNQAARRQSAES